MGHRLHLVLTHLVVGLLAGFWLGCASSGVPLSEVTEQSIALVYWDEQGARKRMERARSQSEMPVPVLRRGVASLRDVARLVSSSQSGGGQAGGRIPSRIMFLNPQTLELTPFEAAPLNARPLAWSHDRKRLLYNSSHGGSGRPQLYEFEMQTGHVRKLTHGLTYHLEGDYGPNGGLLYNWIEMQGEESQAGLDVRPVGVSQVEPILRDVLASGPRWSPRGGLITYFRADERKKRRDESTIVVQTPKLDSPTRTVARGRDPVFTPDGEWIIYAGQASQGWRLRRVRPDGSARATLGKSHLDARWPAVSPDGLHVAYVSNADGTDRLYLRRMDGTGDRILLKDGAVAFPVW